MYRSKLVLNTSIFLLIFLFGLTASFAQTEVKPPQPVEPSYDVTLQVVIGSNDGAGQPLPAELATISRHLRENFQFTNYRVADTFLGRVANRGDLEYKSVFNILDQKAEAESQSFLDWSLRGLKSGKDAADKPSFQADTFRFGGRIPLRFAMDTIGKQAPIISYEQIGLNLQRFTLPVNTPTLVGTITMTKALGTMFVVITVKSAN